MAINPAVKYGIIVFVLSRIFLTFWAIFVTTIQPIPEEPDELLRPYLGEPILSESVSGILLGPWQRFDTQHYVRIARLGYAAEEDSVFPPLYPLAIRGMGYIFPDLMSPNESHMTAAIVISNLAFLGTLILLYKVTVDELNEQAALRAIIYLAIFPTAFFLLAGYTESIFILLALGAIWFARQGRFWTGGLFGFMAPLMRLTGWILVVPLAFEYLEQRGFRWRKIRLDFLAVFLPLISAAGFLGWRQWAGLPPIGEIYQAYWHQTTGVPGADLLTALSKMVLGEAPITLYADFLVVLLLTGMTVATFRKLGVTYGLYCAMLLLFMLLPKSQLKPLFSFTRYALAFFPMFMVFGRAGENPWINRLIVYPSIALYLYFSGQFFMWGWVA
jgi:Gpi18-like mannosyltransferase